MSERKCNNCKVHYWIDTDHCQSCGSMNTVIVSDNRTLADYDFNLRGQIIDGDCRTLVTDGISKKRNYGEDLGHHEYN